MPRSAARPWTPAARAVLALLAWLPFAPQAVAEEIFEVRELRVSGRPILAFSLRLDGRGAGRDLGVLVVRGGPPDEEREVALFATRALGLAPAAATIAVPPEVVAVDVADVDPAPGDELVFVAAHALRIVPTVPGVPPRTIPLDPPLPLPPRAHDLSLLGATRDWSGAGEPQALLPTTDGALLVGLRSGARAPLAAPVVGAYESLDRTTTARDNFFYAELAWPSFVLGRDDGDARQDLFSLSRYGIDVFRGDLVGGFPARPSRTMRLRPFSAEEELRPRATQVQQLARDLDGDGLTDLVVHRSFGTLLRSEDRTEIYRNEGTGADVNAAPAARVPPRAGVSVLDAVDLDGDGRLELVQARIGFGLVQILRALTTRRVQVELRVDRIDPPGISGLSRAWADTISVGLDFEQGRLEGLFPTVDGDWNGDGRRDLLLGLSRDEIGILLGRAGTDGPGFSGASVSQKVPASGRALVADLDGDGLDDLVVHDPRDATGVVRWLRNRGTLPGASPALRATQPAPEP